MLPCQKTQVQSQLFEIVFSPWMVGGNNWEPTDLGVSAPKEKIEVKVNLILDARGNSGLAGYSRGQKTFISLEWPL